MSDRPKTAVIEGRADIRSIATLARYFVEQGNPPRSKSELVRFIIETFTDILVANDVTQRFQSSQRAKEYMGQISMSYGKDDRLFNSLIHQIQKETLEDEGFNPSSPEVGVTDEATQEALRIFEEENPELVPKAKDKAEQGVAGPIPVKEEEDEQD